VLFACIMPLLLCTYQLRALAKESGGDELASLLTYELIKSEPLQLDSPAATTARLAGAASADEQGECS
jgi:hypothetical protein